MTFRVGDRVRCVRVCDGQRRAVGKEGVLVRAQPDLYSVEFDEFIDGHNCGHRGKQGHCWNFWDEGYLEHIGVFVTTADKEARSYIDRELGRNLS